MDVHFIGEVEELDEGIELVCGILELKRAAGGIPIQVTQAKGPLQAACQNGSGQIIYEKKIHFFRALGLWAEARRKQEAFHIVEEFQFDTNGVMVDASRNAVLTTDSIVTLLKRMAVMGLNMLMMYTEDTFEMENYPYFGYMRGRYSEEELRTCDECAAKLGIEMVPCIQTLAHLTEALKWNYAAGMKDTDDILLAGSEETYRFIEDMLVRASKPFRSKRIHIGMDEAHMLGLGKYLSEHGYRKRFDIMNEHLQKVADIAGSLDLKPMIWSDMYFRLGSKTGGYYDLDAEIPAEVARSIPGEVQLVYWDYYHKDEQFYREFIRKHQALGSKPVFAGGVWVWNGMAPNYGKTLATTNAALNACKKEGVREVFATMWGDNGAETPLFAGLAGLQLFAEHGYAKEVDEARLAERFACCADGSYSDFMALNEFDETPGVSEHNMYESNPSKYLLWQDALIGLYDVNIQGLPMNQHYEELFKKMKAAAERSGAWSDLFHFYAALAQVLSRKSEIGLQLKQAYDQGNHEELQRLSKRLAEVRRDVESLRNLHRDLWFRCNKAFGWEVLDIRYGGVLSRLETAVHRIDDFVGGRIERIEELEAERLFYDAPWVMPEGALGRGAYHRIVSASPLSQ